MEKQVTIQGMKCDGCAARVKEALETIATVTSATVDLSEKRVRIQSNKEISIDEIKQALSDTKFTVA